MMITILLHWVGYNLNFWDYPIEFVPLLPGALPFDVSMISVPYMLLRGHGNRMAYEMRKGLIPIKEIKPPYA